jgi:hypothetical protein
MGALEAVVGTTAQLMEILAQTSDVAFDAVYCLSKLSHLERN